MPWAVAEEELQNTPASEFKQEVPRRPRAGGFGSSDSLGLLILALPLVGGEAGASSIASCNPALPSVHWGPLDLRLRGSGGWRG